MCWDNATSGLGVRHIYSQYNSTSGDIVDDIVEQLGLEQVDIAVWILFLTVLFADIVLVPVWAAAISISLPVT